MMLTLSGVSSSGPGAAMEEICLDVAGNVETGRRNGGGSEYTSTGG